MPFANPRKRAQYEATVERRRRKSAAARRHERKYPERKKEQNKRFLEKRRAVLWGLKDKPCHDCGINYPPYVMQFDHVPERGEKVFNIGASFASYSVEKLLEEIAKCDLVCANCHAERTHQRRSDR